MEEDFLSSLGLLLDLRTLQHFSPGVLWEETGQNSLFHDRHCHHSPEQFQLTEKDRKIKGCVQKNYS
jgi:hypothetical protein